MEMERKDRRDVECYTTVEGGALCCVLVVGGFSGGSIRRCLFKANRISQ